MAVWWDILLILAVCALVLPALWALRPARVSRWMEPATAEALGAMRMWISAILLASVLWEDLASTAHLPRGMLRYDHQWLPELLSALPLGFDRFMASAAALQAFETATAMLLGLAMVGLFTRWTVPAAAVAYLLFASILRSYAWFYHTGLVPLYALLLLSFTPCGDAFSLDRLLRVRRGLPVPPAREPRLRYGVGRYLVWMAVALPYTMAGLSKLRNGGPLWWQGDHMKQMLVSTILEPMHFDFQLTFGLLRWPGWLFDALGLAAVLGEVTFGLVLVSALARRVLPALMAAMHVGILVLMNILFPDLIAIQAVFYDWTPLRRRLEAWTSRWRRAARAPPPLPERVPDPAVRRQAVLAAAFLLVASVCWAGRIEAFPFTGMQMFSRRHLAEPVQYVRPLVRYEDGTVAPARCERWIGAMADSR
ncbi:MAG TPA: hypothetical protein VFX98_12560, partial [Longimicrobiaceae bacterium]|nr:hypothetical protein [Longimicrobiaceae bacterium]